MAEQSTETANHNSNVKEKGGRTGTVGVVAALAAFAALSLPRVSERTSEEGSGELLQIKGTADPLSHQAPPMLTQPFQDPSPRSFRPEPARERERENSTRDTIVNVPDTENGEHVSTVPLGTTIGSDRTKSYADMALALETRATALPGLPIQILEREPIGSMVRFHFKVLLYSKEYKQHIEEKQAFEYGLRKGNSLAPKLHTSTAHRCYPEIRESAGAPTLARGEAFSISESDWRSTVPVYQKFSVELPIGMEADFIALAEKNRLNFYYIPEIETSRSAAIKVSGGITEDLRNEMEEALEILRMDKGTVRPLTGDERSQLIAKITAKVQKYTTIEGDPALLPSIIGEISSGIVRVLLETRTGQENVQAFLANNKDFREALSAHLKEEIRVNNESQEHEDMKTEFQLHENAHIKGSQSNTGGSLSAIYYVAASVSADKTKSEQDIIRTLNGWTKNYGVRWSKSSTENVYLPTEIEVAAKSNIEAAALKVFDIAAQVQDDSRITTGFEECRPFSFTVEDLENLETTEEAQLAKLKKDFQGVISSLRWSSLEIERALEPSQNMAREAEEALDIIYALRDGGPPHQNQRILMQLVNGLFQSEEKGEVLLAQKKVLSEKLSAFLRLPPEVSERLSDMLIDQRFPRPQAEYLRVEDCKRIEEEIQSISDIKEVQERLSEMKERQKDAEALLEELRKRNAEGKDDLLARGVRRLAKHLEVAQERGVQLEASDQFAARLGDLKSAMHSINNEQIAWSKKIVSALIDVLYNNRIEIRGNEERRLLDLWISEQRKKYGL